MTLGHELLEQLPTDSADAEWLEQYLDLEQTHLDDPPWGNS